MKNDVLRNVLVKLSLASTFVAALLVPHFVFGEPIEGFMEGFASAVSAESAAIRVEHRDMSLVAPRVVCGVVGFTPSVGGTPAVYNTTAFQNGWHELSDSATGARTSVLTLNSGYAVEGGRLSGAVTWGPGEVHWVRNAVIVPSGCVLTVEAGAVVKFGEGTYIRVEDGGEVIFAGSQDSHVILTHFADDVYGGDADFGSSSPEWNSWSVSALSGGSITDCYTEPRYGTLATLPTLSMTSAVVATRSSGCVRIPVTFSGDVPKRALLSWVAIDGTAQHGVDFTLASGNLVVTTGTIGFIDIPLVERDNIESLHHFEVAATTVEGVNINPQYIRTSVTVARGAGAAPAAACAQSEASPVTRIELRDPDPVPSTVLEDENVKVYGGRLSADTVWDAQVATNFIANTIVVPNGVTLTVVTNATVFFTPHTGIKVEDGGILRALGTHDEPALLTAANAGDWTFTLLSGAVFSDAYTIFENTVVSAHPTASLPGGVEMSERNEEVKIPVSISGSRSTPFRVRWRAIDGTAAYPDDYTVASGEIEWSSSSDSAKYITIPVPNDGVLEEAETFDVELFHGEGVNIGASSRCTVLVRDGTAALFPAGVYAESESSEAIRLETREHDPLPETLPDGWVVEGGRLAESAVWGGFEETAAATNFVLNTVVVPDGVTLTVITNGTVFFAPYTGIKVEPGGTLRTVGSQEAPVVFAAGSDGDYNINVVAGGTFSDLWTSFRNLQYGGFGTVRLDGKLVVDSDAGVIRVPVYISGSRSTTFSADWLASDGACGTIVWGGSGEGTKWIELPITDGRLEDFSIALVDGRGINVSQTASATAVQIYTSAVPVPVSCVSESSEAVRFECREEGTLARALVFGQEYMSEDGESAAVKWDSASVADGWKENGILVRNSGAYAIECGRLPAGENVWGPDKVHIVRSWVVVPSGSSLTIQAGTVVKFCELTGLKVEQGASLVVAGTEECPVVYTSAADDTIGGDSDLREVEPAWGDYSLAIVSGGSYTDTNCAIRYVTLPNYGTITTPAKAIAAESAGYVRVPVFISTDRTTKFCVDWRIRGNAAYAASGRVNWSGKGEGTKYIDLPLTRGTVTDGFDNFTVEFYESQGINVSTTARMCEVTIYADDRFPEAACAQSAESAPARIETREYTTDLEIGGSSRIALCGGRLAGDATWGTGPVYLVRNTVVVPDGVTLTISAGAVVKFLPFTGIKVEPGGKVVANGTVARNIVFTSISDDSVGGNTDGRAAEPAHGTYALTVVSGGSLSTSETQVRYGTSGTFGKVGITAAAVAGRATGYVRIPVMVRSASPQPFSVDWRVTAPGGASVNHAAYGRLDWKGGSTATQFIDIPLYSAAAFTAGEAFEVELCVSRGVSLDLSATTCAVTLYDTINTFSGGDSGVMQSEWAQFASLDASLDSPDETLFAAASERLAYSARWDGAAEAAVGVGGETLAQCGSGAEGVFTWETTGLAPGRYTLHHETLDAAGGVIANITRDFIVSDAILHERYIFDDETWEGGKVHIVRGDVSVLNAATLEIGRGAIVKFMPGSRLATFDGGVCIAKGVTFTHAADDTVGGDALFDGDASEPVDGEYRLSGSFVMSDITDVRFADVADLQAEVINEPSIVAGENATVAVTDDGYAVTATGDATLDASDVHVYALLDGDIVDTTAGWNVSVAADGKSATVTLKPPFAVAAGGGAPGEEPAAEEPWTENEDGSVTLNVAVVPGLYYAAASASELGELECPGADEPARAGDKVVAPKAQGASRGFYRVWVSPTPIKPAQ